MQQLINRIQKAKFIKKSTGEILFIDLGARRNPNRDKTSGKYISKADLYFDEPKPK